MSFTGNDQPTPPPAAAPAPQAPASKPRTTLASMLLSGTTLTALASWAGGVALRSGYHINVPFLATWLGLMVAAVTTGHFTHVVSSMWHFEKTRSAAQIAAQAKVAEVLAEAAAKDYLAKQGK